MFIYAVAEHVELLRRPEPFLLSEGAEQSVLIFEAIGVYAVVEGLLQFRSTLRAFWARRVLTVLILLDTFIWLVMGGPVYEPWFFSGAIALLFVASAWSIALRRAAVTPNSTIERDARKGGARPSL